MKLFSIVVMILSFLSFLNFFHFFFFSFFLHCRCRRAIFYYFIVKFYLDFNSFDFENIQQLLIFSFEETKSIFRYLRSLFQLNQEISKTFCFRICDICLIISYVINDDNHVINIILLFHFFSHASDTTIEFINNNK